MVLVLIAPLAISRTGAAEIFENNSVPDPAGWVYDNAYRDGDFGYFNMNRFAGNHPFHDFMKLKLGCLRGIDDGRYSLNYNLASIFGGRPNGMLYVNDQYFVGYSCDHFFCPQKALVILDLVNRWAAFGMAHTKDNWNFPGEDFNSIFYSEKYQTYYSIPVVSLFLVDDSSAEFNAAADRLIKAWLNRYSLSNGRKDKYNNDKYYVDNPQVKTYAFRCDPPK